MTLTRDLLSPDQATVYDAVIAWYKSPGKKPWLSLGGLAGTGKTTLVGVLSSVLEKTTTVVYTAYTGIATNRLRQKLTAVGSRGQSDTVHGLIYTPVIHVHKRGEGRGYGRDGDGFEDPFGERPTAEEVVKDCPDGNACKKRGKPVGWKKKLGIEAGLVILDEASMIGADMWRDLLACGVPVLAVGDHGQLPPVGSAMTNLMLEPDLRLEKIHRQAEGNPILTLAHYVRNGGLVNDFLSFHDKSDNRVVKSGSYEELVGSWAGKFSPLETATICYRNATRVHYNRTARKIYGREGLLATGDAVICLKNDKNLGVFNGMRGMVREIRSDKVHDLQAAVEFPDDRLKYNFDLCGEQFGREKTFESPFEVPNEAGDTGTFENWGEVGHLFDYGYAMTCHKAQGSQWKEVALIGENLGMRNGDEDFRRRFVYTAVTRAAERLHLVPVGR